MIHVHSLVLGTVVAGSLALAANRPHVAQTGQDRPTGTGDATTQDTSRLPLSVEPGKKVSYEVQIRGASTMPSTGADPTRRDVGGEREPGATDDEARTGARPVPAVPGNERVQTFELELEIERSAEASGSLVHLKVRPRDSQMEKNFEALVLPDGTVQRFSPAPKDSGKGMEDKGEPTGTGTQKGDTQRGAGEESLQTLAQLTPDKVEKHLQCIFGAGLHEEPLQEGKTYEIGMQKTAWKDTGLAGKPAEPGRDEAPGQGATDMRGAKPEFAEGAMEDVALRFVRTESTGGQRLAHFVLVRTERGVTGRPTEAGSRTEGPLKGSPDLLGVANYRLDDGMLEELTYSRVPASLEQPGRSGEAPGRERDADPTRPAEGRMSQPGQQGPDFISIRRVM